MAVRSCCFFCVALGGFLVATVDFGLPNTPYKMSHLVI